MLNKNTSLPPSLAVVLKVMSTPTFLPYFSATLWASLGCNTYKAFRNIDAPQGDWQAGEQRTCSGPQPTSGSARVLRRIACDLYRSGKFQSVLTPNYNEGHRDHFHIDIRPDDPRAFLR